MARVALKVFEAGARIIGLRLAAVVREMLCDRPK